MVQSNGTSHKLSILNENPSKLKGPILLHDLVRTASDAPAIDFLENGLKRRKFCYKTLHALSDALAGTIVRISAKLGCVSPIIPVLIPQSPELYVVLLAVLKAGKAFCPLNLDTPAERLKFILEDISAGFIITLSSYIEKISATSAIRAIFADRELAEAEDESRLSLPQVSTNDLAYVLYTSGSTGLPKAVSVSHRAVTQSLLAHDNHIPHFERFLQFAAPTFDVSIFEIFFPWYRGRTLVGCTRGQMLDNLPGLIGDLEIDAAELTPTVVSTLLHGRRSVPGLKLLLTIGEMLTQHVVDEYGGDKGTESMLWAMYGPTEAAIHCTLQPQFSTCSTIGTIGVPLETVSAFIVTLSSDKNASTDVEVLPIGAVGELVIGGPQIAEEYINRPELTAASFIEHPKYGRLYRTGDRARLRNDGSLECLGRVTSGQVKVRGQRVELGEIEQVITKIDACRTATVMMIEDKLVAFCATGSQKVSRSDVLDICQAWLPSVMVPSEVWFMDSIPQLPSGKVDRGSLKSKYVVPPQKNGHSKSNPNDRVGCTISRILDDHIKRRLVLDTTLASIGLDSLQAIRIASALRKEGFALGAMDVLAAVTLRDLIAACKSNSTNGHHEVYDELYGVPAGEASPELHTWHDQIACTLQCTPLQEAMLAETAARPGAYCNWIEVEISVSRTYDQIRNALLELSQQNEILRTGFTPVASEAGAYKQIVWKEQFASQIRQVSGFTRKFTMTSSEALLRPLSIQIKNNIGKPRILFQIHHALYDGWSFDLLLQDLDRSLHMEKTVLRPQFRDVVRYFSRELRTSDHDLAKEYWTKFLQDFVPTVLPNYNGHTTHTSELQSFSGRSNIQPSLLYQRAHELAINPQVYFQAATAYILSLYSGSADVTLGNVASGRTIPVTGVEDILGPCIASLPFRIDFRDTLRVRDILLQTQRLNRESLHHCAFPLREIARTAGVLPGTRLFDVLFIWQQSLGSSANDLLVAKVVDSADNLEFNITLEFEPRVDYISFRATFNPSNIPENQIRYLSRQVDDLVLLFLTDTECAVPAIDRCFSTTSLSIANPNPRQRPIEYGLSHAVEKWALEDPSRPAVSFWHVVDGLLQIKATATYEALNTRANQMAHILSEYITQEDQLIAVIMEKSVDLYVSILAVLKLGCGYLPLVPETPRERIQTILDDAQISVCITSSAISVSLPQNSPFKIIEVDLIDLSTRSATNLDVPYNGSHLAYAVYTSGSTGTPKGVLVTQDNLMSNLQYLSEVYPYSKESVFLQACSQAFDVSVFEIFFSWHVGICLCTASKDNLFHNFEAAINRLGATHLSLTPTVAALVDPINVPKVEFLVTAGEALTEHVRRQWAGRGLYQGKQGFSHYLTSLTKRSGYGPSETTNICTVKPKVTFSDLINNIGAPFDNTSVFVLDPDSDDILPRGAVGELCFGGSQVFRGYLNRPELNATKLIDHPIAGRIYRSGDMGILLQDDSILSAGRSDDQVKVRGQRVELGEITSIILDDPEVRDCVTLLLTRSTGVATLVNFWVSTKSVGESFRPLGSADLRSKTLALFQTLSHRLPSYMVPSHILSVSCLPMTAQAKIDKRLLQSTFNALSEDDLAHATALQDDDSDGSELSEWERAVAEILAKTLNLPASNIQRGSSFFNLGLDSVSAIRFCNELRSANLGNLSISMVLKNPSITRLASIEEIMPSSKELLMPSSVDLDRIFKPEQISQIISHYNQQDLQVTRILPCTPLQEAMLSTVGSTSSSAYCNLMVLDIKGDIERLQRCWSSMIQRHQILRTSFLPTEDASHAFAQVILEDFDLTWHFESLQSDIQIRIAEKVMMLLDTNRPPIYLAIASEGTATKLLFGCHHALYDGIATSVLLHEVECAYDGAKLSLPIAYDVYLQHMLSQDLTEADRYWQTTFTNFEPTFFPDLTGKALKTHAVSATTTRHLQLPLSMVRKSCQGASISLLSVIQATWAKLLHFYTGESDICFGNVVSGRALPGEGLNRLVAPCFNTLPVRVMFNFQEHNAALTELINGINIEMLAFQLTPLRRIQSVVLEEGGRLFDTLVILQQPAEPLNSSIWTLEQDLGDMDLPVVCEVFQDEAEDVLRLELHYQTSLLSGADAMMVAETFDHTISSLVNAPQQSANLITTLPTPLRAEANMTTAPFKFDTPCLHSGLERMAATNPDLIALDFLHPNGTRTKWSFKTLNERANGIAQALLENYVAPEAIIPIHLYKSPSFYASILGVLKAGAAFAPVHPELPDARKRLMLEELKPKIILCSAHSLIHSAGAMAIKVEAISQYSGKDHAISELKASNLAYCLFTSGSTGTPKAVSMEHRAPMHTIESSRTLIPWTSSSRLLQYAAVTFDMCYYDCFLAWTLGFTLCAAEQDQLLNELPKTVVELETDLLDLTPSVAVSLKRSEVPSVKWLYCIGEAMSIEVVNEWGVACVNSYGPTEAAFCTTISPVSSDVSTSVIGKPFPSTSFAIFPPQGEHPVPVLSVGELYIGGSQLARDYLGKPKLTNEKFVLKNGRRFYRSGDMVRMLSDGNFEFLGRADDQVKIRGLRVELGEINHVLQDSHSDVKTVVTQILKKDKCAKEQLVAFLVLDPTDDGADEADLRRQLRIAATEQLPSYMVPQFFIFMEKIPKSMAGKIDKGALTSLFRDLNQEQVLPNGVEGHESEHDWTEVETSVRNVLARLSKTSEGDILPTTTIYQLGLDSISAVQIAAALRKQGRTVTAAGVMKYMSCKDIAAHIDRATIVERPSASHFDFDAFEQEHKVTVIQACGIDAKDIAAIRPCTPLQKGMISQFLAKDGAVYFNYLRLQLQTGVDWTKLKEAWAATVARHIILRTGFAHAKDTRHPFVMVQYNQGASELPWFAITESESSQSIDTWLQQLQRNALSKFHHPPWAIRVLREGGQVHVELAIFHALFDAQSLQIIFNDVAAAYRDQSFSAAIELDPAIAGIISSSSRGTTEGASFWTQLGTKANPSRFPNLAPLRYDPMPSEICTRRSSRSLGDLETGCRTANITLQAAGIASWLSLLSAYTGEPSITCGIVLSGRTFDAAQNAVFPCINTVPFACTTMTDRKATLDTVMALSAEIQQHQLTPLNEVQRLMGFPNETLFDTIFAYQKLSNDETANDLWSVVDEKAAIEYPVSIELEPKGGFLEYHLTILPHVIPKEQGELILDQFDYLMDSFIFHTGSGDRSAAVNSEIFSITPAKESILPSEAKLLHELVEMTAVGHPQRVALEFAHSIHGDTYDSKSWTYAELDREGNKIAHLLISHNVQPGELVGVCFDKCAEASFAMLGILKAGCAFVAIDPGAPAARQAFVVKDSDARAVLSMSRQSAQFANDVNVPVLNLDQVTTYSMPDSKPVLQREVYPQDRSYCLYTSGTTGTPKGCELTHENAVQALLAFQRLFAGHWDAQSRWLQFASFHFDVSVLEQFWSWSVGICVVSAPRDLIFEDIAQSISTLAITHIDLTPSLAQILHPDDVPSLCKGVFITGGESLKQEILDVWGPKSVIYNGYGPTEATIGCTMYTRVPANGKPSNIGWQFDNVGSLVLQPGTDVPVLRGGIGELCVSGKLVGKGYLNRPDLTTERFPYLNRFGERVYRTGDLVRVLHDSSFDFLGRADDQVKLRGQRLEVGEINSVIRQSRDDIADVATLVLTHPKQQKEQLVSFVVMGAMSAKSAEVLVSDDANGMANAKEACNEKLPPYMVPTHFVPLTSMPLNINNKADAKKLKAIYEDLSSKNLQKLSATTNEREESWTKVDQNVRRVLVETLDISEDAIAKDTSFFELGMDSISVISVSRAMKHAGLSNVTASMVMRCPTVRRLAKALSSDGPSSSDRGSILAAQQAITAIQHRHRRAVAQSLSVEPSDIEALAPCTPLQQGMIARYLEGENGLYFNSFQINLSSDVDEKRLRRAWESVVASTQILRTEFANTEDGYIQAVLHESALKWSSHTLTERKTTSGYLEGLRVQWIALNRAELKQLFEMHMVTTPNDKLLIIHIFHGLYDGNSIEMMLQSAWDAYSGRKVDSKTPSFYSALAHGPLRAVEGAKRFWQNHLMTLDIAPFPSLIDAPTVQPITITRTLHGLVAFDTIRRKLNVTAQAIAQACWLSVLQQYVKGAVTTGLVVSGRSIDLEGADQIVGPMFNTIPFQYNSQSSESWASTIQRVHEFNVAAHPYQHTPLRDIMKWSGRSPNQPLFDTLFVYQIGQDNEEWAKSEVWEVLDGEAVADYPLALEVEQRTNDTFKLTLVTQGQISNATTSNELLGRFEEALNQILNGPESIPDTLNGIIGNVSKTVMETKVLTNGIAVEVDFTWTKNAIKIREEVAKLSDSNIHDISETTSIFEIGLDSIDAIKLSSRLKKRSVDLPVSGIMRSLTIAKMLQHITTQDSQQERNSSQSDLDQHKLMLKSYLDSNNTDTSDVEEVVPLTPLQEAMVAEMVASEYARYYNFDVMKLEASTDVDHLRNAWIQVVKASPILRTGFVEVDHPELESPFAQIIYRRPHEFWSRIQVHSEADFPKLFDTLRNEAVSSELATPAFRVLLAETPSESYLVLAIAHALYDGWSLRLLHSDVHEAYRDQFIVRPSYEPTLADILSASGSNAKGYWQDYLSGAKPSAFPRRQTISETGSSLVHRSERSSSISLANVTSFAKKQNVSLQTLGQTVFAMVLASYTQCLDVTFGSVLSGRDDEQRAHLLFPTMNTVAIRSILHGTCTEMLRYVQNNFTNVQQWQHFPLRKALSLAGIEGRLFESLFIYQKSLEQRKNAGRALYTSIQGHSDVEYPVCVEMEVVGETLVWRCAVKEEVFSRTEGEQLLEQLDAAFERIMERSDAPVIELTSDGTSVCGLTAFDEDDRAVSDAISIANEKVNGIAPLTPTALSIRQVLATVSKTPEVDITSDMTIFHLGLDSITAIKVSSLLRKQNITLSVGEMLRAGTFAKMARIVAERAVESTESEGDHQATIIEALKCLNHVKILRQANIGRKKVAEILPITAGQLYMLSMWLNTKGNNFYAEFSYEVLGNTTYDSLQKAWQDLVDANPILRTVVVATGNDHMPYVQVVLRQIQASVTNLVGQSDEQGRNTIASLASRQPWAHLFVRKAAIGWSLKLKIHHALYDGVSLPLMMQQLQALCNGFIAPSPTGTFSKLIASGLAVFARKTRETFWTNYLHGISQQKVPQLPAAPTAKTEVFYPLLLRTVSLEATARKNGISTQAFFLATYAKLYAALTRTPHYHDISIGVYLANRSHPLADIATTAIPTVTLLPLRIGSPLNHPIIDLAAQIQNDLQQISDPVHASASLFEIAEWTGVKIDTFVNFLTLPVDEEDDALYRSEKYIEINPVGGWQDTVCGTSVLGNVETEELEQFANEHINGAFLVS